MKTAPTSNRWKITKEAARLHGEQKLVALLTPFCRAGNDHFYIVDYSRRKIIRSNASSFTLSGYAGEAIKKEGFDFYRRILTEQHHQWLAQMVAAVHRFFDTYTPEQRQLLEYHYDLIATTVEKQPIVLHHKVIPYQFCANGHLWLALCGITSSPLLAATATCRAYIENRHIGERYPFAGTDFVHSGEKVLTTEEITILERLFHGIPEKGITEALHISDTSLRRKLQQIREKLGVPTTCGAVGRACILGLIR